MKFMIEIGFLLLYCTGDPMQFGGGVTIPHTPPPLPLKNFVNEGPENIAHDVKNERYIVHYSCCY